MEPERNIEKQLREFAEKRREEAGEPMELHPATRRLLQGEVARRAPKSDAGASSPGTLRWLRSLLVPALTVAALVVVICGLLLPGLSASKSRSLAAVKQNELRQRELAQKPAESPPPAAPMLEPAAGGARTFTLASEDKNLREADAGAKRAEPEKLKAELAIDETKSFSNADTNMLGLMDSLGGLQTGAVEIASRMVSLKADSYGFPVTNRFDVAAGKAPVEESRVDAAGELAVNAPGMGGARARGGPEETLQSASFEKAGRQQFAQIPGTPVSFSGISNPSPVLAVFTVEQSDRELRVVDGDGSVYTGYLQFEDANGVAASAGVPSKPPSLALDASRDSKTVEPAATGYFFQVAGTNFTLKQNVVFTGNFSSIGGQRRFDDSLNTNTNTNTIRSAQSAAGVVQNFQPVSLPNSQIAGTALIAGTNRIEVKALPVFLK